MHLDYNIYFEDLQTKNTQNRHHNTYFWYDDFFIYLTLVMLVLCLNAKIYQHALIIFL